MNNRPVRSYEYKNDYLYIVIREFPELGKNVHVYCCGINISRFKILCWQKAGICSHPAVRGLQLLRADVSAYALKQGVETRKSELSCAPITPSGKGWYHEKSLLIDNASPMAIRDILEFSVMDLVKLVLSVSAPDVKLPNKPPGPPELQKWLDSLSRNLKGVISANR